MSTLKSQKRSIFLSICFAMCLLFASAATTHAATFTVTNTNDSGAGSLRQAIIDANASNGDDVIDFELSDCPCVITLTTGVLSIASNDSLTINGTGADQLSVSGNGTSGVFYIGDPFNVTNGITAINGITVTGSRGSGRSGIIIRSGRLALADSTVSGNSAQHGGGIFIDGGTLTLTNSTITDNSAYWGGGILNDGTLTLINSTVSGNSANTGGGIFNHFDTLTLSNSTVTGNSATSSGGGIFLEAGVMTLNNTIIANSSGGDCGVGVYGSPFSNASYSLVEDGSCGLTGPGNLAGDPNLGPLVDNGGPTLTHALLPGSPAIDAGINPSVLTTDQRGLARTVDDPDVVNAAGGDGTDIGSFEYGGTVYTITKTADTNDGSCDAADCSLHEAILVANATAGTETIIFGIPTTDPGYDPAADRYTITLTSALPDLDSDMSILGLGAKRLTVTRDASAANFGIFRVNESKNVTISGLTISRGNAALGGAIENLGSLIVAASTLSDNVAVGSGGAIRNGGRSLEILDTVISGNRAGYWGGGIYNDFFWSGGNLNPATVATSNVTISNNSSNNLGGGVYNVGFFNAVNTTITENRSDLDSPSSGGGGVYSMRYGTTLKNTIIAGNSTGLDASPSDYNGADLVSAEFSMVGGDAHLGPLHDNGGPTMTHAPLCGSPVIDAGKNVSVLTADQRGAGFARTFDDPAATNAVDGDGTDIGSFELQEALVCNTAPVANDDSYSTDEDTPLSGSSVLNNDADVEGDTLMAVLVAGPTHGSVILNGDGSFSYTPAADFNGSDSFTYTASDGTSDSNVATVTITVDPVNDAPVTEPESYGTDEDTSVSGTSVLANDSDVDNDTLTAVLVVYPSNSQEFVLNEDGTFSYTPVANFTGTDSFTYIANDGSLDSNLETVAINVYAVNDAPVAVSDSYSTDEDAALSGNVLANDTDVEGDTLSAVLASGPAHGTLTLNGDGTFSYTPAANFNGSDSFTYVTDDGPLDSNVATVTITVRAINDAPTVSLASPATQTVQYSDNVVQVNWLATDVDSTSVIATLEYSFNGGAFVPLSSPELLLARSINCNSGDCSASVYGTISIPAGVYTIRFKVRDAEFTSYSDHVLTVTKEHTETEYTGDDYALTAGPTVDTANVRLAAQLTQQADGKAGEITKAKVSFLLFKSGNTGSTPDLSFSGVPVDASGAALTFANLPVDIWTVKVKIDADNGYWKASPVGMDTITIDQPTNELRTSGGGWVADSESVNGKGNFGFNVAKQKKGVRGSSVYLFRGVDGFNYLVKSTSWNNGGIGFNKQSGLISLASFSGKCVVQKIDPATGDVVESFGNYSFSVNVRDGDLFDPRRPDKYAITILDGSGHVWRQVGAPNSPLIIGGGNVTVKGK